MKYTVTALFTFLLFTVNGQKLPEMVIDSSVFVNSLDIKTMTVTDTNDVCYQEGHYVLGTHRYIRYTTLLANVGDTVAYYGKPAEDTANWAEDLCHHHYHYKKGIQVKLYRWIDNAWSLISENQKLDYDMVNNDKYPAGYRATFLGFDSLGQPIRRHDLYLHYQLDTNWFKQYSEIDTIAARWKCCPAGGGYDQFYLYPEVDYTSNDRGIMPYFSDTYYNSTEGNWNVIPVVFPKTSVWASVSLPPVDAFKVVPVKDNPVPKVISSTSPTPAVPRPRSLFVFIEFVNFSSSNSFMAS